jgi:hypothetical protein
VSKHPHKAACHTFGREKMEKVSGNADNFESQADKAERFGDHDEDDHKFACGGYTAVERSK